MLCSYYEFNFTKVQQKEGIIMLMFLWILQGIYVRLSLISSVP